MLKRGLALVISLLYYVASRVLITVGALQPKPTILTYHSILPSDAQAFERQIRRLAGSRRTTFVDDMLSRSEQGVAVTFDDALQNVFDNALPILAKYAVPSTIFVPTGYIGAAPGWIHPSRNPQRVAGLVASIEAFRRADPRMTRFGSHTVTHAKLDRLSRDVRLHELSTSKSDLESIVGGRIRVLSLPYGRWNDSVLADARHAGYQWVLANVPVGPRDEPGSLLVGRIDVSPHDSMVEFWLKSAGAYEWMALAVPAKRAALSLMRPTLLR